MRTLTSLVFLRMYTRKFSYMRRSEILPGHSDVTSRKVQVGKDQEKAQSEKDSHSKNQGGKNQTNNQVLIP